MTTPKKRRIPLASGQPLPKKAKNSTFDETHIQAAIDAVAYIDLTNETDDIDMQPRDWDASYRGNSGIRSETQSAGTAAAPPAGVYDTCFGLLCMQAISSRRERVPLECTPAALRFEGKVVRIDLNANHDSIAVLVSETLSHLVTEFAVTLTATVCGKRQESNAPNGVMGRMFLSLRIIVYGFMQQKDAVADTLAEGNLFLQHPGETEFDRSVKYVNPQYLLGPGQELPRVEELSVSTCCAPHGPHSAQVRGPLSEIEVNQVQQIFDTAATSNEVTSLPQVSSRIVTELKRHQVEALAMMIEKEEGTHEQGHFPSIWKAYRTAGGRITYQNIVTELFETSPPDPLGGGILADEMGLGKTLSSLSLVCHHLDQMDQTAHLSQKTPRTTLIVTPKSTIYGWQKQISNHILPERIRWLTYYGPNRQEDSGEMGQFDIVLTTYDTLRSEEIRKGPLFKNKWARVILDEAHKIRNRNSRIFRAVRVLDSQRRWCLTGTPIQNCIDDFGALLSFIQTPSLRTKESFDAFIARPVKEKKKNSIEMLRKVVAATCLRRTKNNYSSQLNLPRKKEMVEYVTMEGDDRELYEFFKRFSFLTAGGDNTPNGRPATNILVLISMLRLICDHGEALLTDAALRAWKGRDEKLLTWKTLQSNVKQCVSCCCDVEGVVGELVHEELSCGHVFCDSCVAKSQNSDSQRSCRLCGTVDVRSPSFRSEPSSQAGPSNPMRLRLPPSAKLEAIVRNISQRQEHSKSSKAVIFSYWTKMLDLIGNALHERGWVFQRIDGQSSLTQRKGALEKFGNDSKCNIILASIGAAGEGIDLTSASSVHIVEPHWNPMAESQAVDRVHRIGQKQDVEVVRYVVKDSIEEYVRWVQYHKLQLIKESLSASDQKIDVTEVRWKKLLEFLE
ncbi:SNF2 family N-terminal domain-containing protein [Aspergillus minisclerotigenes]|uniref:SNF2 family N-terminal domain-containing protein n=1 Tax=Aspergillus minisclerotigenes TaxID=656917 RepID=A0A5N6IX07_9EURO|nr:SNF2 family N-terminal domain-containing protein [Aspergillus minisclerotigenes]